MLLPKVTVKRSVNQSQNFLEMKSMTFQSDNFEKMVLWAEQLSFQDIPENVIKLVKAQAFSTLGAIYAGIEVASTRYGYTPVFEDRYPFPYDRRISLEDNILQLANLVSLIDYDDVILGGHTSQSSIIIPMVYGYINGATEEHILKSMVVTNELTGRISMSCSLGRHRGQTAGYVHQAGSVLAKGIIHREEAKVVTSALKLSLSFITTMDSESFFSGDTKVLSASCPINHGFYCLKMAKEGLLGRLIFSQEEAEFSRHYGFFPVPRLFNDLGSVWYSTGLSLKLYPICAYMCSSCEAFEYLVDKHQLKPKHIKRIIVEGNLLQYATDLKMEPYLRSDSPLPHTVRSFSSKHALASLLYHGEFTPATYVNQTNKEHASIRKIYDRIEVRFSFKYTLKALFTDLPLGFTLRKVALYKAITFINLGIIKAVGFRKYCKDILSVAALNLRYAIERTFYNQAEKLNFSKELGSKVTVITLDGKVFEYQVDIPKGFAGREDEASMLNKSIIKFSTAALRYLNSNVVIQHKQNLFKNHSGRLSTQSSSAS